MARFAVWLAVCLFLAPHVAAQQVKDGFDGIKTEWHGFDQFDFEVDDVACRVVAPRRAASGGPWIWRARFWGHEPQTDVALLERGFHVAYCDVANLWGNDEALRRWERFYEVATGKHGLSKTPALEGMSRGGLMIYRWALAHPDRVSCIYGDAPAMGIRPYVEGRKPGDADLEKLSGWMKAHQLTLDAAQKYSRDALDHAKPLAAAGVPVIHVCGDADESVSYEAHTAEFARRYKKHGGLIRVIVKRGGKHHPHSLKDPTPIVDFIVAHQPIDPPPMPKLGVCGHRGASATHPENTLAAFREAIRLGAQMIEFDVALTKDGKLVLMHDATVDRTTDGSGRVSELTLAEIQKLDAGSWKAGRFKGERAPTLAEALAIMPDNLWLNVHLKGGAELAKKTAREIVASGRRRQAFLACGDKAAAAARRVDPQILICNMNRQGNSQQYVDETIAMKAGFIQLLAGNVDPAHTAQLRKAKVRINYCCTDDAPKARRLFSAGVEFPLVDQLAELLKVADERGIARLQPTFRSRLRRAGLGRPYATLLERRRLAKGAANQGLALSTKFIFTSTASSIFRYDHDWKLQKEKAIRIEGVNHVGAIDFHDGFLWAGLLHGPENGKHDPKKNRSIIAKIRPDDLGVAQTWDITKDVTWIDPVCFDGQWLWVGDLSDLGIHRYRIDGDQLVRDGVFRYPKAMHFSQGVRVVGDKLYSIHTFGQMDGLFEFRLPKKLSDEPQHPLRVWAIDESQMHLEGFDFVPGKPNEIWHAQGKQVDRYRLWNEE